MSENMVIGFEMLVVGMSGVFTVLSFFAGLIWVMKEINRRMELRQQPVSAHQIFVEENNTTVATSNDDDNIIMVLASVAVAVLGKKAKVKKIHFLNQGSADGSWSVSGRQDVLTSHNIIKKG